MPHYTTEYITRTGAGRRGCQDSLLIRHASVEESGEVLVCAVADGLGGLAAGELASAEVVRGISGWFTGAFLAGTPPDGGEKLIDSFKTCVNEADRRIRRISEAKSVRMGTTLSALVITGGAAFLAHIGDSRIYRMDRDGAAILLTEDHSLAARRHDTTGDVRQRSVLYRCIGAGDRSDVDIRSLPQERAAGYLLCTDGFWHSVSPAEMASSLTVGSLTSLADLAVLRGERDDITAVTVRCREEEVACHGA